MTGQTVTHLRNILININGCFDKAEAFAEKKKVELDVLANYRLAADMFCTIEQVQSACDAAKFCAAYLAQKTPPKHEDNETTWVQMRERLKTVINYLESFKDSDFEKADAMQIKPGWAKGQWATGADYLNQIAVPNFYFHATMTYAILRHAGVDIGKMDYLGKINLQGERTP